jgi:8-oxo-dGTP pyrophosphatase MutT (NUDIX family)
MLDIEVGREGPPPRDAATLIVVRDAPDGIEVFCVERNKKSRFLGGAIVFPGGKLDEADRDAAWAAHTTPTDDDAFRALGVTACREALEEAAILPVEGGVVTHEDLLALRTRVDAKETTLLAFLAERSLRLDLAGLHPFARWLTPLVEARRYDTRFFLTVAPAGQIGAHDDFETMSSFWAAPEKLLARFLAGEVQLAPPTHRTLEFLARFAGVTEAIAATRAASLEVICPTLVPHKDPNGEETMALVLPGDPEHEIKESRVVGRSRYVLRAGRWLPENPP